MTPSRHILVLAVAAMLGAGSVALPAAFAQTPSPAVPPASNAAPATPSSPAAAATKAAPHSAAAVEVRIKRLHDQLKITSAETDQWNAVAQIMRDNESKLSDLIQKRAKNAVAMSAVDNLRSYEAITDAHEDGLKKLVPAFEKLYASMSDAQKKTADAVFSQRTRARAAATKPAKPSNG